jgi:predicted membrane channel-forming protein YqfA (hemolysin III family)
MAFAAGITVGVVLFAWLISRILFKHLTPKAVLPDYKRCSGNWHEEELADCKSGLHRVPQQPINTYTNLAYLAAGVFVHFHLDTGPSFVFAVTMTYLAIGSALYHATSTRWAGMLDVTGIYTVFSSIAVYALVVLVTGGWSYTPILMFIVAGVCASVLSRVRTRRTPSYKEGNSGDRMRTVITVSLGVAYVCVLLRMARTGNWRDWYPLIASLLVFVVGYISWGLDRKRRFPTAIASALLFYAVDATTSTLGKG